MKKLTKEEQKEEAYEAYRAIENEAWETCEETENPAWIAYEEIRLLAYDAYQAKCKEIDEQEE